MILAAGLLGSRGYRSPVRSEVLVTRSVLIGLSIVAMVAIVVPLLGAEAVRDSQTAAASGDLNTALDKAKHAHDLQSYAAAPDMQQALVLELMGNYRGALAPARDATHAAAKDWRAWLVLSRLEAEAGHAAASAIAYERAKSLNPRSVLFQAAELPR
jgi:hypothetical protein